MAKIGKAPEAPQPAEDPEAVAERRRADLKRAIELGVLKPLTQEGVDPGRRAVPLPKVSEPALKEAETWEEAVVEKKKDWGAHGVDWIYEGEEWPTQEGVDPDADVDEEPGVTDPDVDPDVTPSVAPRPKVAVAEEAPEVVEEESGPSEEDTDEGDTGDTGESSSAARDLIRRILGGGARGDTGDIGEGDTGEFGGERSGTPGQTNTDIYTPHLPDFLQDDPDALSAAARDAAEKQYIKEGYITKGADQTWDIEVDGEPWTMERYGDQVWLVNPDTGEILRQPDISDPDSPLYLEERRMVGVPPMTPMETFEKIDETQSDWKEPE